MSLNIMSLAVTNNLWQVWHIKPEFEHYLHMENFDGEEDEQATKKAKAMKTSAASNSKSPAHSQHSKTSKSDSGSGSAKRKREEEENADEQPQQQQQQPQPHKSAKVGAAKEPKKFKRAFGFFVKAMRADAEAKIGDPKASETADLRLTT
jgi:hypothetical protein